MSYTYKSNTIPTQSQLAIATITCKLIYYKPKTLKYLPMWDNPTFIISVSLNVWATNKVQHMHSINKTGIDGDKVGSSNPL